MLKRKRLFSLIKSAETAQRMIGESFFGTIGVSYSQFAALNTISENPGISSAQLGRIQFMTPQAAGEIVSALVAKGLVERTPGKCKPIRLNLTPLGWKIFERTQAPLDALEREIFADMPAEHVEHTRLVLIRLIELAQSGFAVSAATYGLS